MEIALTKTDVARRQLVTAIRLLFENGDPVSIYSLAANAWEIIDVLCNKAGSESLSNETRDHIQDGKDLKRHFVNPYRNFFKHADEDPEAVLTSFDESNIDSVIFLGVEDYLRLNKKSPVEFQVFQLWYLATNVEKLSVHSFNEMMPTVESIFPSIRELPRSPQIQMGHQVLEDALKNNGVINDTRTEPAMYNC